MKWTWKVLPDVFDVKTYGCMGNKYSFVVGKRNTGEWIASWQDHSVSPTQSIFIDGGPFKTRDAAEAACRRTFKELQTRH